MGNHFRRSRTERTTFDVSAAFRRCNEAWIALIDELFQGLGVSKAKQRRVRVLIPVAVEGIHLNAGLSTLIDPVEARAALVDVTVGYLTS